MGEMGEMIHHGSNPVLNHTYDLCDGSLMEKTNIRKETEAKGRIFTFLTGARPVAGTSTVTYESVPAFFTDTSILAGVAFTLLAGLLVARWFDASAILGLGDLTYVLTSAVDEKVPDTANIPVVKHGCPELGW